MSAPSDPTPPPTNSSSDPSPPKPSTDSNPTASTSEDVAMIDDVAAPVIPEEEPLPEEILRASPEEIMTRVRLIDNDLKVSFLIPFLGCLA